MNVVLFDSADERPGGLVALGGDRARHVSSVLRAVPGDPIRLGRSGGPLHLSGRVVSVSPSGGVLVEPGPPSPPPPRAGADLLLALPRPKCLKRLWPQLAALGPARVFVTAAEKVEKSYWGCTWLREEERGALMREGLAQAGDTVAPAVSAVRRLKPFLEDVVPSLYAPGKRFFAHPPERGADSPAGGGVAGFAAAADPADPALVAVGPEGGWSPFEIEMLERLGFRRVSLGPRILRTDTAVVALLSIASAAFRASVRPENEEPLP